MNSSLMYVGVTHEKAPISERAYYAWNEDQKKKLADKLFRKFALKGLTILTTCNRTEVYFESNSAKPNQIIDVILNFVEGIHAVKLNRKVFTTYTTTIETITHLLNLGSGLKSAVIGDKQILNQVRESYLDSLRQKRQGSLLERAFQSVFKSHKRIVNESLYLNGSTSTAYSALKLVQQFFGKEKINDLKVLIVGAGEFAQDVVKYLPKYNFGSTSITNRSMHKAQLLADHFSLQVYDWEKVEAQDFSHFDVIITAVSNRKNLINEISQDGKKRLWVDLAMPSNISSAIANEDNVIYNLDEVAQQINNISKIQSQALPTVISIIEEELIIFQDWFQKSQIREYYREYKEFARETFINTIPAKLLDSLTASELEFYSNKLAETLVNKSAKAIDNITNGEASKQLKVINNVLTEVA